MATMHFTAGLLVLMLSWLGNGVAAISSPVPADFDCSMRVLALKFANELQPWRSPTSIQRLVDALNSAPEAQCRNLTLPSPYNWKERGDSNYVLAGGQKIVVSKNGTVQTLAAAVALSRKAGSANTTIVMMQGTYFLDETIILDHRDSWLTIKANDGDEVWLSGGQVLQTDWKPHNLGDQMSPESGLQAFVADLSGQNLSELSSLRTNGSRMTRARYPNVESIEKGFNSELKAQAWLPPREFQAPAVIHPSSPTRPSGSLFEQYALGVGGPCEGQYEPAAGFWCASNESIAGGGDDDDPTIPRGGAKSYTIPQGMVADSSVLPHLSRYSDDAVAGGAEVFAWRKNRWESWMFELKSIDKETGTFLFGKGGFQGARGDREGGTFYIENVFAELDYAGEFFYNTSTKKLYIVANQTTAASLLAGSARSISGKINGEGVGDGAGGGAGGGGGGGDFVATRLHRLLHISGTSAAPVVGLRLQGLGFRDTKVSGRLLVDCWVYYCLTSPPTSHLTHLLTPHTSPHHTRLLPPPALLAGKLLAPAHHALWGRLEHSQGGSSARRGK
jgi:hypothetical protein